MYSVGSARRPLQEALARNHAIVVCRDSDPQRVRLTSTAGAPFVLAPFCGWPRYLRPIQASC
jgi:hypothetical protein